MIAADISEILLINFSSNLIMRRSALAFGMITNYSDSYTIFDNAKENIFKSSQDIWSNLDNMAFIDNMDAQQFHIDSYSTQKGKGTLYGTIRVAEHLRQCSEEYTSDCYIMKLDIKGFFMSIDKERLFKCAMDFTRRYFSGLELEELEYLLRKTIFNRPERNCIRKVPPSRWIGLPLNKSLFGTDGTRGLPIGNLTSQLLALLYLDPLDHLITEEWGVTHYGRYVDDMVLIHPSKVHLLQVKERIKNWLTEQGLTLHPKKVYLQHYTKGVCFVGSVIKPGRIYLSRRSYGRLVGHIHYFNWLLGSSDELGMEDLEQVRASMNSYLGMMRHFNAVRLCRRAIFRLDPGWYKYFHIYVCGRKCKVELHKGLTGRASLISQLEQPDIPML